MLRWHGQGHLPAGSRAWLPPQHPPPALQDLRDAPAKPREAPSEIGGNSAACLGNPSESCEPQVREEGAREAPALARDSVGAAGAGPSPTAPAVTLSDELHAIRRC